MPRKAHYRIGDVVATVGGGRGRAAERWEPRSDQPLRMVNEVSGS
jgi:hypothetical protein